jgi:hypothetical protein
MDNTLMHRGYFLLVLLIGIVGLAAAFWQSKRSARTQDGKRSLLDYLLLWPLLFGKERTSPGTGRATGISARVIIGWLVVLVLIVLAMVFDW